MKNIVKAALLCATLLLTVVAPSLADDPGKQPAPAAPAAGEEQVQESPANGGGCPADGKCCGSAACAEAKKHPLKDGKAAMADCPCQRNKNKPRHDH